MRDVAVRERDLSGVRDAFQRSNVLDDSPVQQKLLHLWRAERRGRGRGDRGLRRGRPRRGKDDQAINRKRDA